MVMALLAIILATGLAHFLTPGPNRTACDMSTSSVTCVVEYPQVPVLKAMSVTMTRTGHLSVCHGIICTNGSTEHAPTLAYGRSNVVGPFRCTSAVAGVKCVVAATGRGFRLSAKGVARVGQ
jgi:hypothetical protein